MSDRVYGQEEKAKLERLVKEGVTVLQEIEDLQGGLKETVKAVAEELNVKLLLLLLVTIAMHNKCFRLV
jgi:hypothetical protein